jgi:hypothetical protein
VFHAFYLLIIWGKNNNNNNNIAFTTFPWVVALSLLLVWRLHGPGKMSLTFLPLDLTASLIAGLVAIVLMGSDHEDGGWGRWVRTNWTVRCTWCNCTFENILADDIKRPEKKGISTYSSKKRHQISIITAHIWQRRLLVRPTIFSVTFLKDDISPFFHIIIFVFAEMQGRGKSLHNNNLSC